MSSYFDQAFFRKQLQTQWLGHSLRYFPKLESTNTHLKKMPSDEVKQGMLCLADHQTRGRGQYERKWESKKAKNLTFSLAFLPASAKRFHVLTLACALALVNYLNDKLKAPCACIKWPNDVMLNDKKVAGLLTETVFNGNNFDRLVIGIGININQQAFPDELSGKATSLSLEMGSPVGREEFLANLLGRIERNYRLWHRQQSNLLKSINRNIEGYGQWVELVVDDEMRDETYKLLGVNEQGQLLMLNHDGGIESFSYEQIRLITH